MALVTVGNGSGFFLTVSLTDNGNNVSNLEYELRGADYAAAVVAAGVIMTELNPMTDAVISAYNISERYQEDAFSYPASGVQNEVKATMIVQLDGSTEKATLNIPAPAQGIFVATAGSNADVVDVNDADVLAYIDLFKSAGQAFVSDGEDAGFIVRGRRTSRKTGMKA